MNPLRNRVVEVRTMPLRDVADNPGQPRIHPEAQLGAIAEALTGIGIAGAALAYQSERTGRLTLIDGHGRKALAPDEPWPVIILDLSDEEADAHLLNFDLLGRAAPYDVEALDALSASVGQQGQHLDALVADLRADFAVGAAEEPEAPDAFPEVDEDLATDFCCPKCGYSWSGKPK